MKRANNWNWVSSIICCSILSVFLFSGFTGFCQDHERSETIPLDFINGESIQTDLDTLKQWIEAMHPSPFARCTEREWEDAFASGKTMYTGGGTRLAAAQVFSRLTNVLKDSHTCVSLKSLSDDMCESHGRLPFEVTTIQNRIFIEGEGIQPFLKGTEIIGVNGQTARMILGMALQLAPIEGESPVGRLRLAEKFWNELGPMIIQTSQGDTVSIEIIDSKGQRSEQSLKMDASHFAQPREKAERPIQWTFDASKPAYLSVKTFQSNKKEFERTLRRGFRKLNRLEDSESKQPIGLVIDIRGNPGGHVALMEMLLPYLSSSPVLLPHAVSIRQSTYTKELNKKTGFSLPVRKNSKYREMRLFSNALRKTPVGSTVEVPFEVPSIPRKRNHYNGPAALLMDGLTASASVAFASWFIQSARGKTFGEPPMGSTSGTFGNPVKRILPQTGLAVNISTAQYFSSTSRRWESKPILPDTPVSWSVSDIQNQNDPVLDAAFQWLQTTH